VSVSWVISHHYKLPCPYCGAPAVGGYEGCQEILHGLTGRFYSGSNRMITYPDYRATIDCYCLQHPEFYCVSSKTLTILHLHGAETSADFRSHLDAWAQSIWIAYSDLQDIARTYIRSAF
jgi:hypothetical protein